MIANQLPYGVHGQITSVLTGSIRVIGKDQQQTQSKEGLDTETVICVFSELKVG